MQDAAPFQILRPRQQRANKILPKKQTQCSQCGAQIKVYVNGWRNPHSRAIMRRYQGITMKAHDLCQKHFKEILREANHA